MGVKPQDSLGADIGELTKAANALTLAGRELAAGAGGVDRYVPPLPDDDHGLVLTIVRFDESRERFDHRAANALESLATDLAAQVIDASDADHFPPLPEAAR